jgi:hypothetical protein
MNSGSTGRPLAQAVKSGGWSCTRKSRLNQMISMAFLTDSGFVSFDESYRIWDFSRPA